MINKLLVLGIAYQMEQLKEFLQKCKNLVMCILK